MDLGKLKQRLLMSTNARQHQVTKQATIPKFDAIANIFGLSELTKKHQVTFDSQEEDAFHVHIDGRVVKFKANNEGLYVYYP